MTRELKSGRKGPQKADTVVVFLHGYGADGADLLGLADPLAPHLPRTAFYAPNAPERCVNNPMGYQWFPIPWMDGSSEEQAKASAAQSFQDINAFLDKILVDEGIPADRLALVGFSQGTMMALSVAPQREPEIAGVVGFSGRLIDPEQPINAKTKPPILLIHGDEDPVVPFDSMGIAGEALQNAGFTVYGHVMKGTGHGISPDGLSVALAFLKERFSARS
ncbi:alpha/beta hydrolase [Paracoccus lutimaris]|uniref:Phospholipase/carboxylesterase n=1 Tax=Paracoccus lutimaris TaxID=1490030 RepID=A0A368YCN6_9RHOB|nr:alpha/beta fold hydrolase [Paracoccus lutimaris]RCW78023.1 phospholipase/carboxylesterase [Paracoccus lutimaris]